MVELLVNSMAHIICRNIPIISNHTTTKNVAPRLHIWLGVVLRKLAMMKLMRTILILHVKLVSTHGTTKLLSLHWPACVVS